MSYRLESSRPRLESPRPRPRSTLPPLRIRSPGYTPSSITSPTTLLYDLPQSSSRSPPPLSADPSPKSPQLPSPTRSRQRTRATPPHSRSVTPAQVARQELDQFAAHCHAWYFDQDENAGQLMTQTVEGLPASQRAPFSRVQASIRSAFHTAMSKRRKSEFRAHLSSTHPGCSLLPHARANPSGKTAQKERFNRFAKFLRTWCTSGMPGTRPFFQGLWALLRLQVLPVDLGGAGSRRVEWELDDAVFQESAGKEFMLEAIDVLKGVLAFDEYLPVPSRRQSDELQPTPVSTPIPPPSPATATRPRSPSDPFLDTPVLSHSVTTSASRSSTIAATLTLSQSASDELIQPPSPGVTPRRAYTPYKELPEDDEADSVDDEPYMRLWTAADLDNHELQCLISLFPDFITRQSLPRFRTPQGRRKVPDLEEGLEITEGGRDVRCGTGRLWIGDKERRDGWRGSWWHRFTGWWRHLFC